MLGKPAINLKLSHFKQIIKSCRGGVSMVIHRMPGNRRQQQRSAGSSLANSTLTLRGIREGGGVSMSDFSSYPSSFQTPGTPGSNLSETTGYCSTHSTSLPSVCSAAISPGTPEIKTGMTGISSFVRRTSPSLNIKSAPSQTLTSQHSGYETDQAGFDLHHSHFRESSLSSSTANSNPYPSSSIMSARALGDISSPYTRPLYLGGGGGGTSGGVNGNSSRTRMSSQSSYGGSSQLSSSILSPKSDATASSSSRFAYSSRSGSHQHHHHHQQLPSPSTFSAGVPRNSFSVDRLESSCRTPHPRTSGDSHVTSSSSFLAGGQHSMSTTNIFRMEMGKHTNV